MESRDVYTGKSLLELIQFQAGEVGTKICGHGLSGPIFELYNGPFGRPALNGRGGT
jgi:hypothetical protein